MRVMCASAREARRRAIKNPASKSVGCHLHRAAARQPQVRALEFKASFCPRKTTLTVVARMIGAHAKTERDTGVLCVCIPSALDLFVIWTSYARRRLASAMIAGDKNRVEERTRVFLRWTAMSIYNLSILVNGLIYLLHIHLSFVQSVWVVDI